MVIHWGSVRQLHGDHPVPQFPLQHLGVGNSCGHAGETGPVSADPALVHVAAPQPPITKKRPTKSEIYMYIYMAFCKDGEPSSCPGNDAGLGKTEWGRGFRGASVRWCEKRFASIGINNARFRSFLFFGGRKLAFFLHFNSAPCSARFGPRVVGRGCGGEAAGTGDARGIQGDPRDPAPPSPRSGRFAAPIPLPAEIDSCPGALPWGYANRYG